MAQRRRKKPDGCGCVFLTNPVTGANVTTIKWCDTHRPRMSMTGRPIAKGGQ